ncbi:MAG: polyprenyl synthetase family protein [Bacteroidetes bacterium]|jgi:octaprenyl-diphosphate synthase|nr:polyprenyl synthetase family protein [Bacteroidota bacterium]
MAEQAILDSNFKNQYSLKSLSDITSPIQNDLDVFRDFFEEQTDTDIFLLNKIIEYLLRQKGKEIRPTLVFMTARMFGSVDRRSYIAATMIELLHTATLIHDDVVDDADKRRGFLSINKLWKNKAGVLLGDFLLSKGLLIALENREYDMLQILSGAVKNMSEGELRQLKTAKLFNMTEDRYFQIITEKTASLISACCECGATAAGASPEVIRTMKDVGMKIGIAFQIKDDLFDYGLDDIGKPKRNDIQERKVTLPLIKAFEKSSTMETIRIKRLMRKRKKSSRDVNRIVEFVHEKNGLLYAKESMEQYTNEALELLQTLPVSNGQDDFESLARFIINRKK